MVSREFFAGKSKGSSGVALSKIVTNIDKVFKVSKVGRNLKMKNEAVLKSLIEGREQSKENVKPKGNHDKEKKEGEKGAEKSRGI